MHLSFRFRKTSVQLKTGVPRSIPKWRAMEAEKVLEGKTADENTLQKAGEAEMVSAEPLEHNEYKVVLARNLIKRAVEQLIG